MGAFRNLIVRVLNSRHIWTPLLGSGTAPVPPLNCARRILVVRVDEIGDFVLTSAFLRELRHSAPSAEITLIVKRSVLPLAAACPHVNRVVVYEWEACRAGRLRPLYARLLALRLRIGYLLGQKFDLVLLPRREADYYNSEFLAHICAGQAGIVKCREGVVQRPHDAPVSRLNTGHLFVNTRVEHEIHHTLNLLRWCGAQPQSDHLELWTSQEDQRFALDFIKANLPGSGPLLILHPSGGRSRLKQWPLENFRKLLDGLHEHADVECLIIGGTDEEWINHAFPNNRRPTTINTVGRVTIGQLAALVGHADLYIGGDSGPMHMAAASGVPVMGIFGPTSERRFRPFGPKAHVVTTRRFCSPDQTGTFRDRCSECPYDSALCLSELSVDVVLGDALKLLKKEHAGSVGNC
jgi:ADP-heptose:LPS heptosyltransferase